MVLDPQRLPTPEPRSLGDGCLLGEVVHVDRFGNLVTNVAAAQLPCGRVHVRLAGRTALGPQGAYADVRQGELTAIVGSHGYLEIALRGGSAVASLGAARGTQAMISPARERSEDYSGFSSSAPVSGSSSST